MYEFGSYYSDLVKDFFSTLQIGLDEFEDHMVYVKVRNIEIIKDMDSFGSILGIPHEGEFIRQGFQPNDGEWESYSKMDYYFQIYRGSQADVLSGQNLSSSRVLCYANNLSIGDRMLHYVIAYVLLSKHSNHSQINDVEMQLIYAIKKNIKVNWALTIMYHMKHQQILSGGLPYARLISRFLEANGLDLRREPQNKMTKKDYEINARTSLKNTRIIKDGDGQFKYKEDSSLNAPQPVPEGGYKNDMLYTNMCSTKATMNRNHREHKLRMALLKRLFRNLTSSRNREPIEEEESEQGEEGDDEEIEDMSESE